jgi:hypothetical protein
MIVLKLRSKPLKAEKKKRKTKVSKKITASWEVSSVLSKIFTHRCPRRENIKFYESFQVYVA